MVNLNAEQNRTLREGMHELRINELRRCASEIIAWIIAWINAGSIDKAEEQVRDTHSTLDRVKRTEDMLHAQMGVHNGT